jgi:hypothetical protein
MSDRRLEILRAIVDEYVATQEPVGSKAIADRHGLGIHQRQFVTKWPSLKKKV